MKQCLANLPAVHAGKQHIALLHLHSNAFSHDNG
jgi:hypothetical protein